MMTHRLVAEILTSIYQLFFQTLSLMCGCGCFQNWVCRLQVIGYISYFYITSAIITGFYVNINIILKCAMTSITQVEYTLIIIQVCYKLTTCSIIFPNVMFYFLMF